MTRNGELHLNTFEPCKKHVNGNFGTCLLCENDHLRDKLREVADSTVLDMDLATMSVTIEMNYSLWKELEPLRGGHK